MNLVNITDKIERFLRNRRLKRLFYEEYADDEKWQQLVAKLP